MRIARLGLVMAGLLATGAAYAGTPGWTISESSGKVSVVATGIVKAALRGGSLSTGDFVTTGANGRAVLVRGEEYLVVAPNSRIRVADPAQSGGLTQIIEHFGNVIYKIKKMTMPHFAVETPFLAAVVKGTTFSVTVTEKGAAVQVVEGRVEVATRDGGASYMVLPGDIGSVNAGAPASLNVQGRETRTIQSTVPVSEAPKAEPIAASLGDTESAPAPAVTVIAQAINEGPVRLDAVSDGMVKGDSSLNAMVAVATTTAPAILAPAETTLDATPVDPVASQPPVSAVTPAPAPVVVAAAPTPAPAPAPTPGAAPAPAVVAVAPTPAPAPAPAPVVAVAAPLPAPVAVSTPAPVVAAATPTPAPVVAVAAPVPAPVAASTPAPVVAAATPQPSFLQTLITAATPVVNAILGNGNGNGNGFGNGNGNGNNGNGNGNGGANGTWKGGFGNGNGNNGLGKSPTR